MVAANVVEDSVDTHEVAAGPLTRRVVGMRHVVGGRKVPSAGVVLCALQGESESSKTLVVRIGWSSLYRGVARSLRSDQTHAVSSLGGFEAFVAAHERRLRQALTATFGVDCGREAAADAFAYAWEHWDRVAGMANPAGYLFVVGRDRHRRRFRSRRAKIVFDIGPGHAEPWCEPALAAQLAGLSDRERIAVMLVNGFEWSLAEVAELLGVSKSTVQTHAERGMAKLRAGMGVTA